jgi:carbon-monoxide dehydrogenase small subunit
MKVEYSLNGLKKSIEIEPDAYLAEVLRQNGCPSVKRSCDMGSCGTCTVLLDGKPILSCAMLAARADGHAITTAEGLSHEIAALSEFLTAEGAEQCGYCSPGFAITILAMKKELQNPTEDQIKSYLAGNLCRCSGYLGQLRAIKKFMGVKA